PGRQRHHLGGGDQRLARHHVGEHRGAAEPVALDHGDRRAELSRDQRGLVSPGAAPENDDPGGRLLAHPRILPHRRWLGWRAWPCTRRTAPTWTPNAWPSAHRTPRCTGPAGWAAGG